LTLSFAQSDSEKKSNEPKPIILFDGSSTAGWHQAGPGKFELKDGTLIGHDGMGLFWHDREFTDFVLSLDWKVNRKGANSGVFVRFPDPGNDPGIAINKGHEIQILDDGTKSGTGSIYSFKDADKLSSKPAGEWNHYEIKVAGSHYIIKLNDEVVNEYESSRALKGHIGLQNHDPTSIPTFKNVQVIDLTATKAIGK
jgi:hypothetical protein